MKWRNCPPTNTETRRPKLRLLDRLRLQLRPTVDDEQRDRSQNDEDEDDRNRSRVHNVVAAVVAAAAAVVVAVDFENAGNAGGDEGSVDREVHSAEGTNIRRLRPRNHRRLRHHRRQCRRHRHLRHRRRHHRRQIFSFPNRGIPLFVGLEMIKMSSAIYVFKRTECFQKWRWNSLERQSWEMDFSDFPRFPRSITESRSCFVTFYSKFVLQICHPNIYKGVQTKPVGYI